MKKNGFSKIILVIIVVIVVLGGLSVLGYYISKPSTTPTTNPYFNKFTGPSGRFSFEYPAKWNVTKNEEKGEYLLEYPKDFVTVFIAEQGYSITEGSIEKNFSEALEKQKTELEAKSATNFSQSKFQKGDKHFLRLDYIPDAFQNIKEKAVFLYIVKPDTVYVISGGSFEDSFEDLEHLIQTFE